MTLTTLLLQTTHQMKILGVCRLTALFQWPVLLYTTLKYVQCMPIEYRTIPFFRVVKLITLNYLVPENTGPYLPHRRDLYEDPTILQSLLLREEWLFLGIGHFLIDRKMSFPLINLFYI